QPPRCDRSRLLQLGYSPVPAALWRRHSTVFALLATSTQNKPSSAKNIRLPSYELSGAHLPQNV
ncbi:MAG TPA: hypothetical protein DHT34_03150, partial [Cellvibrionales bacterium]|nr:hypothetical protein [Cellvibrionales bacterium]